MPATISVKFGVDPGAAEDAPLELEAINDRLEVVKPAKAYRLGETTTLTVEAGRYLIRGRLPSGEWLRTQVNATDGSSVVAVLTPRRASPRRELAQTYFLRANPWQEDASSSLYADMELCLQDFAPGAVKYRIWRYVERKAWERIAEGSTGADADARVQRLDPSEDPRALAVIRVDAVLGERPDSQYWLALNGDWFTPRSVMLPVGREPSRVLLRFVGNRQGHRDPLEVTINVGRKPVAEALLNLITAGDFGAARTIGASFGEMGPLLTGQDEDPMVRVIAAYFLLFAWSHEYLAKWCEDLDDRFTGIPDGAVIHAWYLLRSQGDLRLALARLIAAASRGIPFYTCGLRLLVDGLMLFREHEDTELRAQNRGELDAAWEFVSRYAAVADWAQPTTTVLRPTPIIPERVDSDDDIVTGGVRLHKRR